MYLSLNDPLAIFGDRAHAPDAADMFADGKSTRVEHLTGTADADVSRFRYHVAHVVHLRITVTICEPTPKHRRVAQANSPATVTDRRSDKS